MSVYVHRAPSARRHHDDDTDEAEFRDSLVKAIDEDPRVREAILRLFAAARARKKATPAPGARARRGGA